MNVTSRTGLIPTTKKLRRKLRVTSSDEKLLVPYNLCKSVELCIRPFGDLYNPYSTTCSVLCNHPAPTILRSIIKNAKHTKLPEGKNNNREKDNFETFELDEHDSIPDEYYRRYRDTDSRPMSPSPTNISEKTRTSATGSMINTRRCITPEWGKLEMNKRKQLILDLRRSHSQETITSRGQSDLSHGVESKSKLSEQKSTSQLVRPQSKTENNKNKLAPMPAFIESPTVDTQEQHQQQQQQQPTVVQPLPCINDRNEHDEQEDHRRGKKRKKIKQPTATFHLNKDPETQVSTLGPESVNASTRPSLIPTTDDPIFLSGIDSAKLNEECEALKESFLTEEAFRVLSTGLDIDTLENTFEKYLNRALQEAMKFIYLKKPKTPIPVTDTSSDQKIDKSRLFLQFEKKIPRKLSKSGCRFEIPINLHDLEKMSVFDYLAKFVWVTRQRKQIFKKTFLKFIDQSDDPQSTKERRIATANFRKALIEVLGFYGTPDVLNKIEDLVELDKNEGKLTFRAWCGITSFAERLALYAHEGGNGGTDSCDELEKSDFDSYEERKIFLKLDRKINMVLSIIRKVQ